VNVIAVCVMITKLHLWRYFCTLT